MTTNLHYLIAGMAVLLVVLWQYSHQRQMDDRNSLMFRRLLTVVSLDVLAELVSTCFILYAPYSFGVGRMLSNTVFYLFQAILPLMLLYYVCTLCSSRVISTGTVLRMGIPTIALVFIILTNPFTEKLFYFDSTGYCHGPWYLLLYISALLHIAAVAIFVAVHRDAVSRRNLTALLTVFLLAAFGIAAQAANPAVLTTGFGLSLSILAMYLTINNPCACMDSLTGLNDKQYLLRRMNELTDAHKAFHTITVYAYQLDHMNKVSGVQSGDEFLRRAAEHMQEIAGRNVFRVTGKRFLLLTFSLREYEACLTSLRQVFHTQPDDAQAAPSPVILCAAWWARKSWERAVLCWIMRNISNLSQHAAAGLRSSRTTARTGTAFTTTSRSSSSCTARSTRICSRSIISRSIRCISSALSPLRRSAACGIPHSAGFHRIFLSALRRRTALSARSPSFSCGASAVFCAKTRRFARALRTSRSIFRRSILFTAMAEVT